MKFMRYIIFFLFNCLVLTNLNAQCWKRLGRLDGDSCSTNFAIHNDGTLWAWGINSGIYGNGGTKSSLAPVKVNNDKDWMTVSYNGNFVAGIKTDGSLWCWEVRYSQSNTIETMLPKFLNYGTDWKDVSAKRDGAIALKQNGSLYYIFTYSFDYLALGNDTDWKFLRTFYGFTFAVKNDGSLWKFDKSGYKFIRVGAESDFDKIYGDYAIKSDGTLWFYNHNYPNYFDGTKYQLSKEKWQSLNSGIGWYGKTFGIKADGTLWELISGDIVQVGQDNNWKEIIAGRGHIAALKTDGTIFTWGENDCGQLGNGQLGGNVLSPTIMNTTGCIASSQELDFSESDFNIFPNPSDGEFQLRSISDFKIDSYVIRDMEGRIIVSKTYSNGENIDIRFFKTGVYIIEIYIADLIITKKITKY